MTRRRSPAFLTIALVLLLAGCLLTPEGEAPLRYRDPVFASVDVTADIPYASPVSRHTGEPVTLHADVYEPSGDEATARPAIIWVHGGSFRGGNKSSPEIVDQAQVFAEKGYVTVPINYRLSPTGCTSVSVECILAIADAQTDAQTAVRWLRSEAETHGVDPDRIAIAGSSAGAITALNVGINADPAPGGEYADESSEVGAAVSLSGATVSAAPISDDSAPMLLFHNEEDPLVPYAWAEASHANAIAAGVPAYLITWEGAGHVPYLEHRDKIHTLTTNFVYWSLHLAALPA